MLHKLNERIQGAIAWIIVILVTVTFTLFGLDYYLQSRRETEIKARIDNQTITKQAYELNYRRFSRMQDPEALSAVDEQALKQQVLSTMISNTVRVAAALNQGFEVTPRQANEAIIHIPEFQEDGHFSASRYSQALSNAFFTPQTFEQEVKQGMLLNQQRFALIGSAFVLPNELSQFMQLSLQTRDYDYLVVHAKDFRSKLEISDQEIQSYYKAHQNQFLSKEQMSIDYLRLSLADIKKAITISEDQAYHYYEENKADYLTPAQWQVSYIRFPINDDKEGDQIKQKADAFYEEVSKTPHRFEALAKKNTLDNHAQYGVLPAVVAGQSEWDHYLVNLNQPGQISLPIRTKQGYEIVQIQSYIPATTPSFAAVKQRIIDQLIQEAAQKQYADLEDQLSELSYQNPDSLAPVAKELHLPLEHSGLFAVDTPGTDAITQSKAIVQTAFSHDVLVFGNNSEPVQIDGDTLVVLRVRQHIPAAVQALSQVKSDIHDLLLKQKAIHSAQEYGQSLMKSSVAFPAHLRWQHIHAAARDMEGIDPQINEFAFAVPNLQTYAGQPLSNGDFVLVRLNAITPGQMPTDKEQIANMAQQLEANYGLMDY
ncbi:MAG TPA: SurA N-terminal domain-containing protein, partial [Legionellaceae bacterium]|nr:SurA N-terminal domain-containing protein [Legionellaceae bacterium]